jgi:hypothetical protein
VSGRTPPPPPGAERRRSERIEILAQVELRRGDGEVVLLPVANISAGGVLLRVDRGMLLRGVRVGDQVGIYLDLGGDLSFEVEAEVVRVDLLGGPGRTPGIALMWTSEDPAFAEKLVLALRRAASGR